jgi:hypothetical protein
VKGRIEKSSRKENMERHILNANLVAARIRTGDESTKLINMTMLHPTKVQTARLNGAGAVYLLKTF